MSDMQGKTCLITGATRGIGEVTARELARRGARVVVVARSAERLAATAETIRQQTGAAIETIEADLATRAGVQRAAAEFGARHARLDVLINNAGAIYQGRRESSDGVEMTWALNHLSYFMLTSLLLDTLQASAPARVVNVASDAHRGGRIHWDDVELRRGYNSWAAYSQSKLANVLFTVELARRLEGSGVTANVLHPGFVATGFGKSDGGLMALAMGLMRLMQISPEEGARTSIYLATSPEVEGVSGRYFDRCTPVEPAPAARDMSAAARLWELSERMVSPGPALRGGAGSPA